MTKLFSLNPEFEELKAQKLGLFENIVETVNPETGIITYLFHSANFDSYDSCVLAHQEWKKLYKKKYAEWKELKAKEAQHEKLLNTPWSDSSWSEKSDNNVEPKE